MKLLLVLDSWERSKREDRWIGTREGAENTVESLKSEDISFRIFLRKPWFGLESAVRSLKDVGFLDYEVGMAQFVLPGQPTPELDQFFLRITQTGREFLARNIPESDI